MNTSDEYREAFDIHGDEVECHTCGAKMDVLTVEHWIDIWANDQLIDSEPQCDRCYWSEYYERNGGYDD